MAITYIGLGSNIGNRAQHLNDARYFIQHEIGEILKQSSIYENDAVGFEGNIFFNQVIKVETFLSPESVLYKTQGMEKKMGRTKKTVLKNDAPQYQNRIIDIDILLYNDIYINTETLTIPHPRMNEREFVSKLLKEVRGEE